MGAVPCGLLGPRARAHALIRSLAGLGRGRCEDLRVEASCWNRRRFFNGPGHRVGSCAFSLITLVDSAIPIISIFQMAEHLLGGAVVEAVSLARCAQGGSRSHGRRRFRLCARRTGYAACARRTGFIACDGPNVIGYWPALVMAGANNRAFWPSGDKMND